MATTTGKGRRLIDAVDDSRVVLEALLAELRLANQLEALKLGASALDHDKGDRAKADSSKARVARQNGLRAAIRAGLGLEEVGS